MRGLWRLICLLGLACLPAASSEPSALEQADTRLRAWFHQQGLSPALSCTPDQVLAKTPSHQAEIDVTMYRIDRRPNRPRVWEVRPVPGPRGFRLEVCRARTPYLPQILTQYVTSRGPECQRYVHRDRQGQVVSTVLWFAPGLEKALARKGETDLLYYSVEIGSELSVDFAYAIHQQLQDLRP